MNYLQSFYSLILNFIYKITGRLGENTRNVLLFFAFLLIAAYTPICYSYAQNTILHSFTLELFIGTILIGFVIVFSINGPLHNVKWNKYITIVYFLTGLSMLAVSFIHPIGSGYRAFALLIIFGFPCLYFVWNNRGDYEVFFRLYSAAIATVGILYFILCFFLSLKGQMYVEFSGRTAATMRDSGLLSLFGLTVFNCSSYLFVENKNRMFYIVSLLGMSTGLSILILGNTRTSLIVVALNIIIVAIFCYKNRAGMDIKVKQTTIRVITAIIIIAVVVMCGKCMYNIQVAKFTEGIQSPEIAEEYIKSVQTGQDISERFEQDNATTNDYSSGRIGMWKAYWGYANLLGNDFSKTDWGNFGKDGSPMLARHAHNNFLEYTYRCGIIVAILFFILEIIAGIYGIKELFITKNNRIFMLLVIVFIARFGIDSILDVATLPFERDTALVFYFAMMPFFKKVRGGRE